MSKDQINEICAYCEQSASMYDEDYVLCKKNGVVKKSYVCKKFSFDLMKHIPSESKEMPKVDFVQID